MAKSTNIFSVPAEIRLLFVCINKLLSGNTGEGTSINEVWYKKVVEIDAAYGQERLPLNIFIPKNASPPFKTVIYVPGSNSITSRNSQRFTANGFGFLMRSGYVLIMPVFKGTYERGYSEFPNYVENASKIYQSNFV